MVTRHISQHGDSWVSNEDYKKLAAESRKLAEACKEIAKHEEGCKKRSVGYDFLVHDISSSALSEARKAGIING